MSGFRRAVAVVALALTVSTVTGCAVNPIAKAETVAQRAYATYGTYVIVEEKVADLTAPESRLTPSQKVALGEAAQRTAPVVDTLLSGFEQYEAAKADFESQKTSEQTFMVVVTNLERWSSDARRLVDQLASAIKGVQP